MNATKKKRERRVEISGRAIESEVIRLAWELIHSQKTSLRGKGWSIDAAGT